MCATFNRMTPSLASQWVGYWKGKACIGVPSCVAALAGHRNVYNADIKLNIKIV